MNLYARRLTTAALAVGACVLVAHAAAPATPQGVISGKAFTGITGTEVINLTTAPTFPDSPDFVDFLPYFEWNPTGDINTAPGNWGDNYGSQIVGYFYPPTTASYYFAICSDDSSELYLSTDSDPANKKLIARETEYSNPREYLASAGGSVLNDKLSDFFDASEWPNREADGGILLQANQPYYIEALAKEGGGGDNLSVSVLGPGIDGNLPIPGQYLSSDKANGNTVIILQPQSQTVDEGGSVTFRVDADGTPPYTFQWTRDGADITGATTQTYTVSPALFTDAGASFACRVSGSGGTATSDAAVLTVIQDSTPPTLVGARGSSDKVSLTVTFSEIMDTTSATDLANYSVSPTLTLSNPQMADPATVVFTTSQQALGTEYTLTVNNVTDASSGANPVPANSQATFYGVGALLQRDDGYVVWEAESYDRLLGTLWEKNTDVGTPSGGVAMHMPDNVSDSEAADQLQYDIQFVLDGTHKIWYRARADDGSADSGWLHLDGARPAERDPANGAAANSASMSGFNLGAGVDYVWRSDSQDGPDPMTFDLAASGLHTIAVASREDGAYFDKFIITTDMNYQPSGFGPNPTPREGEPPPPSDLQITLQPVSATVLENRSVTFSTAATTGDPALAIQWQRQQGGSFVDIAGATTPSFTIDPVDASWDGAVLRAMVSIPTDTQYTDEVTLTVSTDSTPPNLVSAGFLASAGTVGLKFDEAVQIGSASFTVAGATVSASELNALDASVVKLTVTGTPADGFDVTANNISDLAGNTGTASGTGVVSALAGQDLGTPTEAGEALSFGSGYYVAAGGADLWGGADAGYFVYQSFDGPFDMRVRVDALIYGDEWGKAALMARESLDADSRNEAVLITKSGPYPTVDEPSPGPYRDGGVNVYNHQWRPVSTSDANSASKATAERISPTVFPSWLRLVREDAADNTFKSYISYDGQTWIDYHTHVLDGAVMPSMLYVGMAQTAHDNTAGFARAEALYGDFSVQTWQPPAENPNLAVSVDGNGDLVVTFEGTLQSADDAAGPFTDTTLSSPATVPPTETMKYYRAKQ